MKDHSQKEDLPPKKVCNHKGLEKMTKKLLGNRDISEIIKISTIIPKRLL